MEFITPGVKTSASLSFAWSVYDQKRVLFFQMLVEVLMWSVSIKCKRVLVWFRIGHKRVLFKPDDNTT